MIKIYRTKFAKFIRNIFNFRPSIDTIDSNKVEISISDAFIWRTDNQICTIFKFKDILKTFFDDNAAQVELIFFDKNNNLLKKKIIDNISKINNLLIDKNFMDGIEDYGIFYIFHNTDSKNKSIIRNSCYTGYKFRDSIPSYVHGNTITAAKDMRKNNFSYGIGGLTFFKRNIYQLQNSFLNKKIELMLINPTKFKIKVFVNEYEFYLKSCCLKKIKISDINIIKIVSKCYLLRPIIFQFVDNKFLDVYHG